MAQEYNAANFTDALTRLPEYGGYEALSGALGEAYPDATFSPHSNDSYDKGFRYESLPTGGGGGNTAGPFTTFSPVGMQRTIGSGNIYDKIYKAVWPTLTGLVNPQPTSTLPPSAFNAPPTSTVARRLERYGTPITQPAEDYRVLVNPQTSTGRVTNNWESLSEAPDFR